MKEAELQNEELMKEAEKDKRLMVQWTEIL